MAGQNSRIPPSLADAWRIDRDVSYGYSTWQGAEELRSWSIEALMELFLRASEERPVTDKPAHHNSNGTCNGHGYDNDSIEPPNVSDNPQRSLATYRARLMHHEHPYVDQRRLLTLFGFEADAGRDIDAAILNGEIYIRTRGTDNKDGRFLISLPELHGILCPRARGTAPQGTTPDTIVYQRQPVEAAITVLDEFRPSALPLHVSNQSFTATFHRLTKNILNGLDWQNVVVAGGMVLTTLLHVNSNDQDKRVQDLDLDIYIYGLSPADAEKKALDIEEVWRSNLPAESHTLVTQNHRTITFVPSYPNRRLQIILKVLPNLTAILLNFDLDVCALAFDGSTVLMLPRCARAIETGYSMFTMDLIWGSHLSDRRSTQESRVLKYADRGFGIRFLPSYENLLRVSRTLDELPWYGDEALGSVDLHGLASAAKLFVREMVARRRGTARSLQLPMPKVIIAADELSQRYPTAGRKGLDNFELFMRHCEAWRLDACDEITYDRAGTSGSYDPTLYDDTPVYKWNENFHPQQLMEAIDEAATKLGIAVESVLGGPFQPVEHHPALYSGRQLYGSNLTSVLRQSLIIPIFMPRLPLDMSNLQTDTYTSPFSAPAILMAMQSRLRTSLVGVGTQLGCDLHFWYIDRAAKWEGADRFWDGTVELMWSLHKWFQTTSQTCQATTNSLFNLADSYGALEVARRYRRRFILLDVPLHHPTSTARLFAGFPTLRESLLFRAWVRRSPPDSMRTRSSAP